MLISVILSFVFIAISHGQDVQLFESSMAALNSLDIWAGIEDAACRDKNANGYCLSDDGDNDCLEMYGGCDIYTVSDIPTVGYTVKIQYFLVQHKKTRYKLNPGEQINFYYSIDDSITNWVLFQSYDGPDAFEYNGPNPDYNVAEHLKTFPLPDACDNNAGIRIRVEHTGNDNKDRVTLDAVRIIGTPMDATTATPTTHTDGPTPTPTDDTPNPTKTTSGPTPMPTGQTPSPTLATSQPTASPVTTPAPVPTVNCDRHRKPWNLLTDTERQLYIDGFKAICDNGEVQRLAQQHVDYFDTIHYVDVFFPWHRQFLWDLETAIRALGGIYSCFSLPYWDWSDEPTKSDYNRYQLTPALLQNVDQMGGDPAGSCISVGPFSDGSYTTSRGQCLRRDIDYGNRAKTTCNFEPPSQIMDCIDNLATYDDWRLYLEYAPHGDPHMCVAENMAGESSPDDPWFYLHHSFIDYLWALWQDCNNYDGKSSMGEVTDAMYGGSVNYILEGFNPTRTVSDVLDMANLGVSYEKGPFWVNADVDSEQNCGMASDPVNPAWFKDTTIRRRRLKGKGVPGDSHHVSRQILSDLKKQGYGRKELVHLWGKKVCQYEQEQSNSICEIPGDFEDCSNMPLNQETNDIDISLEELLNKQGLTDCMKNRRIEVYEWAKTTHGLKGLCDGCFDKVCDRSALRGKCGKDGRAQNRKTAADSIFQKHYHDLDINNNNNYNKYVILGSIILTLSIFIAICIICIIKPCHNKQYKKINGSLEDDIPSDQTEDEEQEEQEKQLI